MKRSKMKIVAPVALSLLLASCGGTMGNTAASSDNSSLGGALLGALAQNVVGNNTNTSNLVNSAVNTGTLISGLIGQLTNSTSMASIVGQWSYVEPSIQFESESFLAKAGGSVASQAIINKLQPYYQKVGITAGALTFVFNKDNTCSYSIKGKTFQGTYAYNASAHTLSITNSLGMTILNAYVTVSANNMAVTFDTTKLLGFMQGISAMSNNATLTTLSTLSKSYNGMKTGFLLKRK